MKNRSLYHHKELLKYSTNIFKDLNKFIIKWQMVMGIRNKYDGADGKYNYWMLRVDHWVIYIYIINQILKMYYYS